MFRSLPQAGKVKIVVEDGVEKEIKITGEEIIQDLLTRKMMLHGFFEDEEDMTLDDLEAGGLPDL